ncbi:MAG TPA: META domain-containing protein [Solirubrobacterales bacterium]
MDNWRHAAPVIVLVLAGVAAFFLIRGSHSHLGGRAGDEIAERIERECGDSTRAKVEPADFKNPAFSGQAAEVDFITCPSGEVNPYAELSRFESPAALRRAFETGGAKVQRDWYCVAGKDAISGDFQDFAGLCRELGGSFRCPPQCQQRVRTHRIPAVPLDRPPGRSQSPAELFNRDFQATAVTQGGQPRPIVGQTKIDVSFGKEDGFVGWSAGCNGMGAKGVRISGDQILIKGFASTAMSCPGPRAQQEQWLNTFFDADPHWELMGKDRLELTSGDKVIDLQETSPTPTCSAPAAPRGTRRSLGRAGRPARRAGTCPAPH